MVPPSDLVGSFLWNIGYSLCHQFPERSFQIGGLQLPVCARDTGTFLGFFVVMLLYFGLARYKRGKLPDKVIIAVAAIGMAFYAFDALSSYLGFRETTNDLRLLSGLAFGSGMSLLLVSAASGGVFKSDATERTFTYRDLPLVYLLIGVLTVPLFFDGGMILYYIEASIIVIGYVLTIFLIMLILVVTLTGWEIGKSQEKFRSVAAATILAVTLLSILWAAHHLTSTAFL